jgi:hypothetical protein
MRENTKHFRSCKVEKQIISAASQENLANTCSHEGCRSFMIAQQLQLLLLLMQNVNKTSTIHQQYMSHTHRMKKESCETRGGRKKEEDSYLNKVIEDAKAFGIFTALNIK